MKHAYIIFAAIAVFYGCCTSTARRVTVGRPSVNSAVQTGDIKVTATEGGDQSATGTKSNDAGSENAYINFEMPSLSGEMLSLRKVVETEGNRYVLLDFWASWCGPCMREVPYLTEAYDKFKDKGFEIFGCSLDNDAGNWKAAVADNGMNWIHVSDLGGWQNEGAAIYGVRSIPANFLIDCSTGDIIAVNLRGNSLERKLAALLE